MESLHSEKNRMNWDHEPRIHKSLEIKATIFRFMESHHPRARMLSGREPEIDSSPSPSV